MCVCIYRLVLIAARSDWNRFSLHHPIRLEEMGIVCPPPVPEPPPHTPNTNTTCSAIASLTRFASVSTSEKKEIHSKGVAKPIVLIKPVAL